MLKTDRYIPIVYTLCKITVDIMAEDCKDSNVEAQPITETPADNQEDKGVGDIDDLSKHIMSSLSTAGLTGQMLVDEVFKGFLARKLEDIESEHQKVHKSKKKKSKDDESSKSRKHKHKKKHKHRSKDRDLEVEGSDLDRKGRRRKYSKSDDELNRNDREQNSQSKQKEENDENKICANEYDQQRDMYIKLNNCDKITDRTKEEVTEGTKVEETEKGERKRDAAVKTSSSNEITGYQKSSFAEFERGEPSSKNKCKHEKVDFEQGVCSDFSLSVNHQKLSNSYQDNKISDDIKNCSSEIYHSDEKTVNLVECGVDHRDNIVVKGSKDDVSQTGIRNKEKTSNLEKNVTLGVNDLSDSKKDVISKNELSACADFSFDQVNIHDQGQGNRSDLNFETQCQKAETATLCLSKFSNFVSHSSVVSNHHVSRSDVHNKREEDSRKKEIEHTRSCEKRLDEDKSRKHSHSKRDKVRSVERDRESKDYGRTSKTDRGHSKDLSAERAVSSSKNRINSSRSHEENKSRDARCRSKEQKRTRSTKSRSTERKHSSRKSSRERGTDRSDSGSRHKSKRRKHKSTREKSVEIIEEEEAESADASDKLTERLLKRLSTSIKKGQELKAEKNSVLESSASLVIDGTQPTSCSPTDDSVIISESNSQMPSQPTVFSSSVDGKDLVNTSMANPSPMNPIDIPVPTVSCESVSTATVKSTLAKVKKPAMKMGIRLTETSVAIISSGIRFESELKDASVEQGEENIGSEPSTKELPKVSVLSNSEDVSGTSVIAHEPEENEICSKQNSNMIELDVRNDKKSKKRKHSRSRSRSREHTDRKRRRERSKERHRRSFRSRSKDRSRRSRSRSEKSGRKSRSRSRDRSRKSRSVSRDRSRRAKVRSRNRERSGSHSRDRDHQSSVDRHRKRSRSRSAEPRKPVQDLRLKIDKAKLREIAIKNVFGNLQSGTKPPGDLKSDAVAALKAGGKSVEELTDFCKRIAEKEKNQSTESPLPEDDKETSDDDKPFSTNTFKARDLVSSIVLNIRNSKPLPVLTSQEKIAKAAELRTQFPVSSGSQHRAKEWVPVEKTKPGESAETSNKKDDEKVFPDPPSEQIDVSHIVSERLSALRKLQTNPSDVQALGCVYKSQQKIQQWAASKQLPGLFIGSTGVNVLSQKDLMGNNPRNQAWVKKDAFTKARPVESGIGKLLLQRMGWKEGEGLGKNNEGMTTPLLVDIKMDRKGLTSIEENPKKGATVTAVPMRFDFSGKHPVSALNEICTKRKWNMPNFIQLEEIGPAHSKMFRFKVEVNGVEYAPISGSPSKKTAKLEAATVCLQELGLLLKS